MPLKVMIIGGGLSGALLANGLLTHSTRDEVEVTVYEREEVTNPREGYQIRLGPAALKGMRACLPEELKTSICAKFGRSGGALQSTPILYDPVTMDVSCDLSKLPDYQKSAPISRGLLRTALSAPLKEQGVIRFGKRFVGYEILGEKGPDGREQVKAKFEDGTEEVGDILIAADGASSRANVQIGLDNHRIKYKNMFWIARGSLTAEKLNTLPKELLKAPVGVAEHGIQLFTSAYLPDKPGATSTQNGEKLEFDEEGASLMVALTVARDRYPENLDEVKSLKQYALDNILNEFHPKIRNIVGAADDDTYIVTPRYSVPPEKDWRAKLMKENPDDRVKGNHRVWFIGDAIHPMLPTRGMGANQSMHDTATALPALLSLVKNKAGPTNAEVVKAVNEYEAEMIPRAFSWVKASGDGELMQFSKLQLFMINRIMDLAVVYTWGKRLLGWTPADEAPELR